MNPKNLCPKCKVGMLLLSSLKKKICVECRTEYPWELAQDQQPLVKHQR